MANDARHSIQGVTEMTHEPEWFLARSLWDSRTCTNATRLGLNELDIVKARRYRNCIKMNLQTGFISVGSCDHRQKVANGGTVTCRAMKSCVVTLPWTRIVVDTIPLPVLRECEQRDTSLLPLFTFEGSRKGTYSTVLSRSSINTFIAVQVRLSPGLRCFDTSKS